MINIPNQVFLIFSEDGCITPHIPIVNGAITLHSGDICVLYRPVRGESIPYIFIDGENNA